MRRRVVCCVIAGLSWALLVAGCTAPDPPSSSHTTKVPRTTPSQTPLTDEELYERAKQMYQEIHGLTSRLETNGGADSLPDQLSAYLTGKYADDMAAHLKDWKEKGYTNLHGEPELVWIKRHDKSRSGSVVAVQACIDSTATGVRHRNGVETVGGVATEQAYFKYFDGELLAFEVTGVWRQSC